MAKQRTSRKTSERGGGRSPLQPLQKALARRTKAELVQALMDLAGGDRKIQRRLESDFNVQHPDDDLTAATRQAIADATDFDEREINYNFDYDYRAYATVQKNLQHLVKAERFADAMELSLELMRKGSYQVEMSDEGMMTDNVEACLQVVIEGLKKSRLNPESIVDWCDEMTQADRLGFIADGELKSLRKRFAEA